MHRARAPVLTENVNSKDIHQFVDSHYRHTFNYLLPNEVIICINHLPKWLIMQLIFGPIVHKTTFGFVAFAKKMYSKILKAAQNSCNSEILRLRHYMQSLFVECKACDLLNQQCFRQKTIKFHFNRESSFIFSSRKERKKLRNFNETMHIKSIKHEHKIGIYPSITIKQLKEIV